MPRGKPTPSTMDFWFRVLGEGVNRAIRVGGKAIQEAMKKGKLGRDEIFFPVTWSVEKIVRYLRRKGVSL